MQFSDQVVVITGASGGIGEAVARQFYGLGAHLVLAARNEADLARLASSLGDPARCLVVPVDLTQAADCRRLIDAAVEQFGRIDVLVNNAGTNLRGPVQTLPPENISTLIDLNLRAPLLLSRMALDHMSSGSSIVQVASLAGRAPVANGATYTSTKFGLRAFTYALAEELTGTEIRASIVSPGPVETQLILNDPADVPDIVFSQPMSTPGDVADAVVRCAADGKLERVVPKMSASITTVGYLFPGVLRALKPMFVRKGKRIKQRYVDDSKRRVQSNQE